MTAPPLLLDYAAAAAAGPSVAGGKGYQLGRLARYGLPVPAGFVVSTAALAQTMDEELADAAHRTDSAPDTLRTRLQATPLSPSLIAALEAEIRHRGWADKPLAVRSSAPQEDSRSASFAGIHDSVLNVRGKDGVADALRAVWASLWTPQAVAYRRCHGITEAAMAVVIMPMVTAVSAGVAFSCDPRSGRDDQVLINAVAGLADALVAGRVGGEEIVLQADQVGEEYSVVHRRGASAGVDDDLAIQLAELVRETAFALDYSAPWFDIEWVWDGVHLHVVQARPVTARPWHTYPALADQAAVWSNGNTRDVAPLVMNAFDWAYSRRVINLLLEQSYRLAGYRLLPGAQRAALFQGRLYLNASFIQWEGYDALGVEPSAMNRLLGGHHPDIVVPPATLRQRAARLGRALRYLARAPVLRRAGRRQVAEAHSACAAWRAEDLTTLPPAELARRLHDLGLHARRLEGLMFLQASSGGTLSLLLDLLDRHFPGEAHAVGAALMAGGEASVTAQQNHDLQELAVTAARDPAAAAWLRTGASDAWQNLPAASPFRREFASFIERYGHRGIYESYMRSPRWREAAGYLLRQVAALLESDPVATRTRQEAARETARHYLARLPWWARRWAASLATRAAREGADRESARSAFTAYGEIGRRLLLEVGRRLSARGELENPAQVFHLTPLEVVAAAAGTLQGTGLRHRVADRERLCAEWDAHPAVDVILEGGARHPAAPAPTPSRATGEGHWQGIAIGAGRASGAARPIRHPEEGGRLAAGEILVAPSTDPAWTPLFLRAGGLAMETGGYLSHGAIVAREFGIPAVANLPGILAAVGDGEPVEVDGARGTLQRISR